MNDRSLLDRISIASPCTADWQQMQGDARRRFCAQCKLHVHDLSGMTADQATTLLREAGQGRVCVRLFRRADGTVLTRDCPVGLRQKLRRMAARAAALWCALWASACGRPIPPVQPPQDMPNEVPKEEPKEVPVPVMGEIEMGIAAPGVRPPATMGRVRVDVPQDPPKK